MDFFAVVENLAFTGTSGPGNFVLGSAGQPLGRGGTHAGGECAQKQKVALLAYELSMMVYLWLHSPHVLKHANTCSFALVLMMWLVVL